MEEVGVPLLAEVGVVVLPFLEGVEVEEVPQLPFQVVEVEGEEVHPCQVEEGVEVEVLHPFQGVVEEVVALILYLIDLKSLTFSLLPDPGARPNLLSSC